MRCLPFSMTRGKLLSQLAQDAAEDPARRALCGYCGASMRIAPDRSEQRVRCPGCLRLQRVTEVQEVPWRLTANAADALRRTKRWLRCV